MYRNYLSRLWFSLVYETIIFYLYKKDFSYDENRQRLRIELHDLCPCLYSSLIKIVVLFVLFRWQHLIVASRGFTCNCTFDKNNHICLLLRNMVHFLIDKSFTFCLSCKSANVVMIKINSSFTSLRNLANHFSMQSVNNAYTDRILK